MSVLLIKRVQVVESLRSGCLCFVVFGGMRWKSVFLRGQTRGSAPTDFVGCYFKVGMEMYIVQR